MAWHLQQTVCGLSPREIGGFGNDVQSNFTPGSGAAGFSGGSVRPHPNPSPKGGGALLFPLSASGRGQGVGSASAPSTANCLTSPVAGNCPEIAGQVMAPSHPELLPCLYPLNRHAP